MTARLFAVLLLSTLVATAASSQSPKEGEKKDPKLDGKDVHEWAKMIHDKDPANRHRAVVALEQFAPLDVRLAAGRELFKKIEPGGEPDNGVRINLIDLVGRIGGIDDPVEAKDSEKEKELKRTLNEDVKTAAQTLANSASGGNGVLRIHALQALGGFGHKAHDQIGRLTSGTIASDATSYEVRRALAQTLGRIGGTEKAGPSPKAITTLTSLAKDTYVPAKDSSVPVRLEALQSLMFLGPAYAEVPNPESKEPIKYNETLKNEVVNVMKARTGEIKSATTNKELEPQLQIWCRMVIIRFSVDDPVELKKQAAAIALHLSDKDLALKLQALQCLAMLGEVASPYLKTLETMTADKDPQIRIASIGVLGAIGGQAAAMEKLMDDAKVKDLKRLAELKEIVVQVGQPLLEIINDPTKEPETRIAALNAFARLGEKGSPGLRVVLKIIDDKENIKDSEGIALLTHALGTTAAMGVKAKDAVGNLTDLSQRVKKAKWERLNSEEYKKLLKSPELQKFLKRLDPEVAKKAISNENTSEDQFEKIVQDAITFIQESAPGRPGPEHKKTGTATGG